MNLKQTSSSQTTFISILGIAVLLVAVIGTSFAVFTYTGTGTKTNTITTGTITMSYIEPTNGISITDMMPTTDDTGKKLASGTNVFDFTVSATITGTVTVNYAVGAKKTTDSTLDNNSVKLYLEELATSGGAFQSVVKGPVVYSESTTEDATTGAPSGIMTLATGSFTSSSSKYYRLRMWVADTYQPTSTSQKFSVKVNVYGKAASK